MDEKFKELIDYARGGAPPVEREVTGMLVSDGPMRFVPAPKSATITPLQPKTEPTVQDKILEALDALAADIRSGAVVPSHLVIGWGISTRYGDEDATSYVFDSFGLNRWEIIGYLITYANTLAAGGDVK